MTVVTLSEIDVPDNYTAENQRLVESLPSHRGAEHSLSVHYVGPRQLQLVDLWGVGREIWRSIDAQDYVNRLRDEWDAR